jgi:hypothetical protein
MLAFSLAAIAALTLGGAASAKTLPPVDQSQTDASWANLEVSSPFRLAQTFTAGHSGDLVGVDLFTWQNVSPTVRPAAAGAVTVAIWSTDVNGVPNAPILATVDATPSADGWNQFIFAASLHIVKDTKYAIVVEAAGGVQLDGTCTDVYPGGQAFAYDAAWMSLPDLATLLHYDPTSVCALDFAFRTYVTADLVTPAPTAGTPPPTATASTPADGGSPDTAFALALAGLLACLAFVSVRRLSLRRG